MSWIAGFGRLKWRAAGLLEHHEVVRGSAFCKFPFYFCYVHCYAVDDISRDSCISVLIVDHGIF